MTPLLKLFIGKFVLLLLWVIGLLTGVYVYLNHYPPTKFTDWLLVVPVGTLLGLLLLFDLLPWIIVKILDTYQNHYGYAVKYGEQE